MRRREAIIAWLFVLPATALIGVFVLWPAIQALEVSVTRARLTQPGPADYCATENYRALWDDPDFGRSVRNTAWFTVLVVPAQVVLALAIAVWVNRPGRAALLLKSAVFLPTVLSLAVLSVLWTLMYSPQTASGTGLINALLDRLGLTAQPFLTSPRQAMASIAFMSVWQGVGLQMLVFLAALQQIPGQLYDAARLDGAGAWARLRNVTLPGVAPTGAFVVMITTIFALKLFVQPHLMTGGGPEGSTLSIVQYVYEAAFHARDLGLACAAGVVFFVAVCSITLVWQRLLRAAEALL